MAKSIKITDIQSLSDYQNLQKLASALWQENNAFHGAAVMVGAGFSRSGATTGDVKHKLPLWYDFAKTLAKDLDGDDNSDPLRLAEEYTAFFGKQALHDLINKEINDSAWSPGELHHSLLRLPWSEVLTTNWDTLLERASKEVHSPVYNIVSKDHDFASARPPRIVKLHGTVNITDELTFTQEDYRKYPQNNAAFVNFARQVFIENELCLVGFSGDDPNFLQWSGWVRDQLATRSRRIYLAGALNLTSQKRKYLESLNIAPIDLHNIVSHFDDPDIKHFEATKLLIRELENLKPKPSWEWRPSKLRSTKTDTDTLNKMREPAAAAKTLEQQLETLEADRQTYPGWLVCPSNLSFEINHQIHTPYPTAASLAEMTVKGREKLLYEIAWQYSITCFQLPDWITGEMLKICDPSNESSLSKKQRLEITLVILNSTRWVSSSTNKTSIAETCKTIIETNAHHWPDSQCQLLYHLALNARDRFDYHSVERFIKQITSEEPEWLLKKAMLLSEVGELEESQLLIEKSYSVLLGQHRNNRNSVHIYSRLAWAHWILRGVKVSNFESPLEPFPTSYQDLKCSPWTHIENIQQRVSKYIKMEKKQLIEPLFEPGHYKDNSNSSTYSMEISPYVLIDSISNNTGMPLFWDSVNFLSEPVTSLLSVDIGYSAHRFSLAIRAASSDTSESLNKVFARTQIAQLSEPDAKSLLENCLIAIEYWDEKLITGKATKKNFVRGRLQVFIEVLARVSLRAQPSQAKDIFKLGLKLGKKSQYQHVWLFKPLNHLLEYSFQSIPVTERHELVEEVLSFPLETEIGLNLHQQWPNPVIENPGERVENTVIDLRLGKIIDQITANSDKSAPALIRLLPLISNNFLTNEECQKISKNLWPDTPIPDIVPVTGLLPHVLMSLPSPEPENTDSLVRKHLFEAPDSTLFNSDFLISIASAAETEDLKVYPSENQAQDYFFRLTEWRCKQDNKDPLGFNEQQDRIKARMIGKALARSIVPALSKSSLSEENFDKLNSFYQGVDSPETIIALVHFSEVSPHIAVIVERLVRQGLQSHDSDKVSFSSFALLKWCELEVHQNKTKELTSRLIYLIGSHRMISLPALLWTALQLLNNNYLSNVHLETLSETVPLIFDSTSYGNIYPESKEAIDFSLTRSACVRLARAIIKEVSENQELERILDEAGVDPLPEVRFA